VASQVSTPLHGFPSLHAACSHVPVVELQESVVHGSPSSQLSGVPGVHALATHVSTPLHGFPSLQSAFDRQGGFALHAVVVGGAASRRKSTSRSCSAGTLGTSRIGSTPTRTAPPRSPARTRLQSNGAPVAAVENVAPATSSASVIVPGLAPVVR